MPRHTPIVTAGLLLGLVGCSAESAFKLNGGAPSDTIASDSTAEPPSATSIDTGDALYEPPVWWSLDGTLVITAGEVDVPASAFEVRLWSADVALLCSLDVPLLAATAEPVPETDPPPYSWWSVDYDDGLSTPACGTWDAGSLALGFGAYDPQLDPALQGHPGLAQALPYALYVQTSIDEPIYVVGVAGTTAQLDGDDGALTSGPLPDETYQLRSLVVLDL